MLGAATTTGGCHGVGLGGGLVAGEVEGEPGLDGDVGADGELGPDDEAGADGDVGVGVGDGKVFETIEVFGGAGSRPDVMADRRDGVVDAAADGAGLPTC